MNVISFYFGKMPSAIFSHHSHSHNGKAKKKKKKKKKNDSDNDSDSESESDTSNHIVLRWKSPHIETLLDGSMGAKIDTDSDVDNMKVLRIIKCKTG